MEIYHPKFHDSELDYTYQRGSYEKSALMTAGRVGKTEERLLLGMGILSLSLTAAEAPGTSIEANMSFQAMAEGMQAYTYKDDRKSYQMTICFSILSLAVSKRGWGNMQMKTNTQ